MHKPATKICDLTKFHQVLLNSLKVQMSWELASEMCRDRHPTANRFLIDQPLLVNPLLCKRKSESDTVIWWNMKKNMVSNILTNWTYAKKLLAIFIIPKTYFPTILRNHIHECVHHEKNVYLIFSQCGRLWEKNTTQFKSCTLKTLCPETICDNLIKVSSCDNLIKIGSVIQRSSLSKKVVTLH